MRFGGKAVIRVRLAANEITIDVKTTAPAFRMR